MIQSRLFILLTFLFVLISGSYSQTRIKGFVIDSTHNNILRSVSVSVYEKGKETVDKVGLTDRFGKFEIEDLNPNKPFVLEFSYTGYQKVLREFVLKKDEQKDFGHINMYFVENEIEVVEVIPPVRMNGDTLEFNADAFQLDSNAVVEDLLRRLPGLVVWGDGAITYNGKEIPSVLVNGKPFFGGDMAVAIQNIDKNAVKKVQVYDSRTKEKQQEDPDDKKYQMNLVLKEGKDKLLFGSVGAGQGTDERYQGHLNLNRSSSKTQMTLAYSTNNVNKNLGSVDQLLKNTSFKGVGINADFDSDFLQSGILHQHVLGARYQYDVLGTNEVGKKNVFSANVLNRWNKTLNTNESFSQLLNATEGEENTRSNKSNSEGDSRSQTALLDYENSVSNFLGRPVGVSSALEFNRFKNEDVSQSLMENAFQDNQSRNDITSESSALENSLSFRTNIELHGKAGRYMYVGGQNTQFNRWNQITYNLNVNANLTDGMNNRLRRGDYIDELNAVNSRFYHRDYEEDNNSRNLNLDFKMRDQRSGFTLGAKARWYGTEDHTTVQDQDGGVKLVNESLSHLSNYRQIQYEPYLEYSKQLFYKNLYGRMYSGLSASGTVAGRFFKDRNTSTLDYRNLDLSYNSFLPSLRLSYYHSKQNSFYSSWSLSYNYNEEYPTLSRMRPIYDDINPAYRNYGTDRLLKKTGVHNFRLNGSYNQQRQYGYNFNFSVSYQRYLDGLTDSVVYAVGQQQVYVAQIAEPMDVFYINFSGNKPFMLSKTQTFTVRFNSSANWGNKFQYVDDQQQEMLNNSQNIGLNFYYTVLDKYQVGWTNNLNRYERYNQIAGNNSNNYTSYSWNTGMSMAYALTKRWSVNTNATGRYNKSGSYTDEALIWNANTTYRMLKGNNLEIKFAAYDLLRQNKGLYFTNGLTEFTTGYRNILTQYYMLSLTYFPRKFGLK